MSENSECIADLHISQRFTLHVSLVRLQCGTSSSRVSSIGCGGNASHSSTMWRRHRMRTLSWCSRLELWRCRLWRTCSAVWHPTQGNKKKKVTYYKIYTRDKYKYVNEINESVLLLQVIVLFTSDKINILSEYRVTLIRAFCSLRVPVICTLQDFR